MEKEDATKALVVVLIFSLFYGESLSGSPLNRNELPSFRFFLFRGDWRAAAPEHLENENAFWRRARKAFGCKL